MAISSRKIEFLTTRFEITSKLLSDLAILLSNTLTFNRQGIYTTWTYSSDLSYYHMPLISKKHYIFIPVAKFDSHLNVWKKVFSIPGNIGNCGWNYRRYKNCSSSQIERLISLNIGYIIEQHLINKFYFIQKLRKMTISSRKSRFLKTRFQTITLIWSLKGIREVHFITYLEYSGLKNLIGQVKLT